MSRSSKAAMVRTGQYVTAVRHVVRASTVRDIKDKFERAITLVGGLTPEQIEKPHRDRRALSGEQDPSAKLGDRVIHF